MLPRRTPAPPEVPALSRLTALLEQSRTGWVPPPPDALAQEVPRVHWRSSRLDPGRRGAAALALVAVLAAVLAGVVVLRSRPHAVPVAPVVHNGSPVPALTRSAPPPPPAEVVVAVSGKVLRPGLVVLPAGSRVDDALRAAGGALPGTDLSSVNLARKLTDGEQVAVGVAPAPGAPDTSGGTTSGPVDLNAATLEQLETLPGVGPVLAQHVLDYRTQHGGRFSSVDQLREVAGIGESKYAQLKDRVRV